MMDPLKELQVVNKYCDKKDNFNTIYMELYSDLYNVSETII